MARVKGGLQAQKRRRNILTQVKGYRFGRSKKKRQAREAIYHAQTYAFAHRRQKKNDFRQLWIARINAGIRPLGMSYSVFAGKLKKGNVVLDRKILATLAAEYPTAFARVAEKVK